MGISARIALVVFAATAALVIPPSASADIALYVHGAGVKALDPIDVQRRIPPGYDLQEVEYPAGLWPWTGLRTATGAQSIAIGAVALDEAIRAALNQGPVLVIGESLGSMVVDQEMRNLAAQLDRPDPALLKFEVIAAPSHPGGLSSYQPNGWPAVLTFTVQQPIPVTPYDLAVLKEQYDGIASWPDRPWHLVSVLNAIVGASVFHSADHYGLMSQSIFDGTFPTEDIVTTVNAQGGVTTTYTQLQDPAFFHLLKPFFPRAVQFLDDLVAPIINMGYSELTPNLGPPRHRAAWSGAGE